MAETNIFKIFARVGVVVKTAEITGEDAAVAHLTALQFQRLQEVLGTENAVVLGFDNGLVVARANLPALVKASDEATPATRTRRANPAAGRIQSRTLYAVTSDPEDVNDLDSAEWDGKSGFAVINSEEFVIYVVEASEIYEVGEASDPTRPVYCLDFANADGEEKTLSAYGVQNLLQRVLNCKERMTPR